MFSPFLLFISQFVLFPPDNFHRYLWRFWRACDRCWNSIECLRIHLSALMENEIGVVWRNTKWEWMQLVLERCSSLLWFSCRINNFCSFWYPNVGGNCCCELLLRTLYAFGDQDLKWPRGCSWYYISFQLNLFVCSFFSSNEAIARLIPLTYFLHLRCYIPLWDENLAFYWNVASWFVIGNRHSQFDKKLVMTPIVLKPMPWRPYHLRCYCCWWCCCSWSCCYDVFKYGMDCIIIMITQTKKKTKKKPSSDGSIRCIGLCQEG